MRLLLGSSNFPQECCKHSLEHVFGSLWSRTLSGTIASEKCSSSQLVDLMMNEVWFGVHRLKSCVSKPNPRQEATFLAGPGWKYPFHLRPAAYGEMLISTTTSMGRTKILQFLPLRPPLGRTTKTCFCVGSDGYIRVEWMPLHSWRLRLWRMNTHQVASEGKVFLTHLAAAPSSVRFLHLFACCAVPVIFCCLLLKLRTKIWGFEPQPCWSSICTGVPGQQEEFCFTCLDYWLFVLKIILIVQLERFHALQSGC